MRKTWMQPHTARLCSFSGSADTPTVSFRHKNYAVVVFMVDPQKVGNCDRKQRSQAVCYFIYSYC